LILMAMASRRNAGLRKRSPMPETIISKKYFAIR
jgi:hypothetical protein